jgi:hypothetical protein
LHTACLTRFSSKLERHFGALIPQQRPERSKEPGDKRTRVVGVDFKSMKGLDDGWQ